MKTYPTVIRFGGPTSAGSIVEQTAAQLGISEAAMDYQALKDAYDRPHDQPLLSPAARAFTRQRMARP